jgi:Tn3 transposase DDE domain
VRSANQSPYAGFLFHCSQTPYTDSAGQSHVGFALCTLLGFELMPRLKAIAAQSCIAPSPVTPFSHRKKGKSRAQE